MSNVRCWRAGDGEFRHRSGAWEVSWPDEYGNLDTALFCGPNAKANALRYAEELRSIELADNLPSIEEMLS